MPRGGGFEISTVAEDGENKSVDICFYSKIVGKMWPHFKDLAIKMSRYWEDKQAGQLTLRQLYEKYDFLFINNLRRKGRKKVIKTLPSIATPSSASNFLGTGFPNQPRNDGSDSEPDDPAERQRQQDQLAKVTVLKDTPGLRQACKIAGLWRKAKTKANNDPKWKKLLDDLAVISPELAEHWSKNSEMYLIEGEITDLKDP